MDPEIAARLAEQDRKLDAIYASVEKMRKYNRFSTIFQVVIFVLPLIGIVFAIPFLLDIVNATQNAYQGLL